MISIRKLETLPRKIRLRKIITLVQDMEYQAAAGAKNLDTGYLLALIQLLANETKLPEWLSERLNHGITILSKFHSNVETESLRRLCNDIRHGLQQYFGIGPADWDLKDFSTGTLRGEKRRIFPLHIFLEDLRSPFNVGSIFRTAESYGVEKIILTPSVPTPEHKRVERTAMGCTNIIPWHQGSIEKCRGIPGVFALETGGVPIDEFPFPKQGTVIIGSEELGISPEAVSIAEKSAGIVSIPTYGVKGSLNVSVAFGILLYFWYHAVIS